MVGGHDLMLDDADFNGGNAVGWALRNRGWEGRGRWSAWRSGARAEFEASRCWVEAVGQSTGSVAEAVDVAEVPGRLSDRRSVRIERA